MEKKRGKKTLKKMKTGKIPSNKKESGHGCT